MNSLSHTSPSSVVDLRLLIRPLKRLLIESVSANGDINNNAFLSILLQLCSTPDHNCDVSPKLLYLDALCKTSFHLLTFMLSFRNVIPVALGASLER